MPFGSIRILRDPISRVELRAIAARGFGDYVKGVVDVARGVLAIDAELHADEEAALLADGSQQADVWGINLYVADETDDWIEFDSMINVRPSQQNASRGVESAELRSVIRNIVNRLVTE